MACPKWTTKDNFDYQFQVNYLSHYLLTRLLLDKICQSSSSPRIINLTSKLYESMIEEIGENMIEYYLSKFLCFSKLVE